MKNLNCFRFFDTSARRSLIFSAEKMARRGRENFEHQQEIIRDHNQKSVLFCNKTLPQKLLEKLRFRFKMMLEKMLECVSFRRILIVGADFPVFKKTDMILENPVMNSSYTQYLTRVFPS